MPKGSNSWRPRLVLAAFALLVGLTCPAPFRGELSAAEEEDLQPGDPTLMLLRDDSVRDELSLDDKQREFLERLFEEFDPPLWILRDLPLKENLEQAEPLVAEFKTRRDKILTAGQLQRLEQLILQNQSLLSLLRKDVTKKIGLNPKKEGRVRKLLQEGDRQMAALRKKEADSSDLPEHLKSAQQELSRKVLAVLSTDERKKFQEMLGKKFDFSRVKNRASKAPELTGLTNWLQSEPLRLSDLKGQVIALHFFAFG